MKFSRKTTIALLFICFASASLYRSYSLSRTTREGDDDFNYYKEAKKIMEEDNRKEVDMLLSKTINRFGNVDNNIDWTFIWAADAKTGTVARPPRDQGNCGSCYAQVLAGLGEVEIYFYVQKEQKAGKPLKDIPLKNYYLSVKNILYCDNTKQKACGNGGNLVVTRGFRSQDSGMLTEYQIPYKDIKEGKCIFAGVPKDTWDNIAYVKFNKQNEFNMHIMDKDQRVTAIKRRLQQGPVGISLKLKGADLFRYDKSFEFFNNKDCGTLDDLHAVIVVALIKKDGKEYFKFRNSHGRYWGDHGYGYLLVEKYKQCSQDSVAQLGDAIPLNTDIAEKLLNLDLDYVSKGDKDYTLESETESITPVQINKMKELPVTEQEKQFEAERQIKRKVYLYNHIKANTLSQVKLLPGDSLKKSDEDLLKELKSEGKYKKMK